MSEKVVEAILDFANALESACVNLRKYIGEAHGIGVKEDVFLNLLGWEVSQGARLGNFETTSRQANNNSDAFNHAYNILKANNAAINKRFHDEGFKFSYWLFSGKEGAIYRQPRKN